MPPKEAIHQTFVSPPEPPPKTHREMQYEKEGLMSDQKKAEDKDEKEKSLSEGGGGTTAPTPALA